jgi:hypothetical protein
MIQHNAKSGEYKSKIVLLEVICDDETVSSSPLDLKDFAGKMKQEMNLKIPDSIVQTFLFDI